MPTLTAEQLKQIELDAEKRFPVYVIYVNDTDNFNRKKRIDENEKERSAYIKGRVVSLEEIS